MDELFTLEEASTFASEYVGKEVTVSNINYLIQYGRIDKTITDKGLCVSKNMSPFSDDGKYNDRRASALRALLQQ